MNYNIFKLDSRKIMRNEFHKIAQNRNDIKWYARKILQNVLVHFDFIKLFTHSDLIFTKSAYTLHAKNKRILLYGI
jgi:hypothetical protein